MELVKIKTLRLLGENEKARTYEFKSLSPSNGRILAFRKAGSVSGNHWHEGKNAAKDPEELLLVSGKVKLYLRPVQTQEWQEVKELEGPLVIHIPKMVFHRLEAISDLCFLEFNSIEEHASDTQYPS